MQPYRALGKFRFGLCTALVVHRCGSKSPGRATLSLGWPHQGQGEAWLLHHGIPFCRGFPCDDGSRGLRSARCLCIIRYVHAHTWYQLCASKTWNKMQPYRLSCNIILLDDRLLLAYANDTAQAAVGSSEGPRTWGAMGRASANGRNQAISERWAKPYYLIGNTIGHIYIYIYI